MAKAPATKGSAKTFFGGSMKKYTGNIKSGSGMKKGGGKKGGKGK